MHKVNITVLENIDEFMLLYNKYNGKNMCSLTKSYINNYTMFSFV